MSLESQDKETPKSAKGEQTPVMRIDFIRKVEGKDTLSPDGKRASVVYEGAFVDKNGRRIDDKIHLFQVWYEKTDRGWHKLSGEDDLGLKQE